MKKYLSLLLGAATVASASAAITVDKQDLTHALIYSGHCEIDIRVILSSISAVVILISPNLY